MAFASWLRSLNRRFQHVPAKRTTRRAARKRSRADKLCLERLEDRTLLSARIIEVTVPTTTNLPPTHSSAPRAITVGPDGNLWFSEFEAQKVGRITPDGHIDEFATQFRHPDQIIAVPGGNLWVVENGNDDYLRPSEGGIPTDPKIEVITPSGAHVTSFNAPPNTNGAGMTVGADGNVWFGEYWDNKIARITPDGHIDPFTISFPVVGVTTEADGTSWILYKSNVIGRIRLDGSATPPVDYTIAGAADYGLRGIVIGPDGNLWMGGLRTHQIFQVSKQGQVLNTYSTVFSPFSMALGADGAIWFTEIDDTNESNSRIGRVTVDGQLTECATPTPNSFSGEIVAGPDGNIWFTELDGNKIGKVVLNAPVMDAGGPYTIHMGDSLRLDASASHYTNGGSLTFTRYTWDIGGRGTFVAASGVRPTLTWSELQNWLPSDGPGTYTVQVQADGVVSPPVTVTVLDTPPTPVIYNAPAASPEGTSISLYGLATDLSSTENAAGFTFSWAVTKNGAAFASGSGGSPNFFTFTPDDNGTYVVTLSATDKDGGTGTTSATISVTNVPPRVNVRTDGQALWPGDLDSSFGSGGKLLTDLGSSDDGAQTVITQPDGKIIAGGWKLVSAGDYDNALVRYNLNGSLDTGFGPNHTGVVITDGGSPYDYIVGLGLQADGKTLAKAWSDSGYLLLRYNPDGTLDSTFGSSGVIPLVGINHSNDFGRDKPVVQSDGKILESGRGDTGIVLERYNADGSPDTGFGPNGNGRITLDLSQATGHLSDSAEYPGDFTLQSDGKILVAATYQDQILSGSPNAVAILRFNQVGSPDTSFGPQHTGLVVITGKLPSDGLTPSISFQSAVAVAVRPDDSILLDTFGDYEGIGGTNPLFELLPDGSLNSGFEPTSALVGPVPGFLFHMGSGLVLRSDGGLVFGNSFGAVRYNSDGSVDTRFGPLGDGVTSTDFNQGRAGAFALAPDGSIVVAGTAYRDASSGFDFALARFIDDNGTPIPAVVNQVLTFNLLARDPSPVDQAAGFTYTIDWGDGSALQRILPSANNGSGVSVTHSYTVAGAYAVQVTATDKDGGVSQTATATVTVIPPASLSGTVFVDFNDDGQIDFGEKGIAGVAIALTGTDDLGHAINLSQLTDGDGAYVFLNLRPGSYYLTETQPAGYLQGIDSVGTAGGSLVATDEFFVQLAAGVDGMNYNYGERPPVTGSVQRGQTATIGFWNNRNGQALIRAFNGGTGTQLAGWLATTLPNIFGVHAGSNNLTGKSDADVAALFQQDFLLKGVKLDAQVLATALSVYATNATLDSTQVAAQYGFTVSGTGLGTATVNVGSNGDAFGVANNTTMTILDLLLATDAQAVNGVLYNGNTAKRNAANNVYSAVNQAGNIN